MVKVVVKVVYVYLLTHITSTHFIHVKYLHSVIVYKLTLKKLYHTNLNQTVQTYSYIT